LSQAPARLAAVLLLAGGLAACAAPQTPGSGTPPARPAAAGPETPRPDPRIERALRALANPGAPVLLPHPGGGAPALDGALLNGLNETETAGLLGPPARMRKDLPAQVWQYDRPECYVDVFFFDDGPGAKVVYVQERQRRIRKISSGACLSAVWSARRAETGR